MRILSTALAATVLVSMFASAPAFADAKPVNLSLITPVSIAKESDSVTAFRFSLLYGKNTSVEVLDLGLISHTTSGLSKGLQWSVVNIAEADFKGAQFASVNYNAGSFEGVQFGFVNHTNNGDGLQLGFVNYAQKMHGIQIGFVNIISQDGFLPVFPIVNWSF